MTLVPISFIPNKLASELRHISYARLRYWQVRNLRFNTRLLFSMEEEFLKTRLGDFISKSSASIKSNTTCILEEENRSLTIIEIREVVYETLLVGAC